MLLDPVRNFAKVQVAGLHTATDTSIPLIAGDGAKLPAPATEGAFNLVWWNETDYKDPADDPSKEIVRCTARSTDTLTITRAQEGTTATAKNLADKTYKMVLALTKKTRDDIVSHIDGTAVGIHGSASAATVSRLVHRDASGRAKMAAPSASDDIATKATADDQPGGVNSGRIAALTEKTTPVAADLLLIEDSAASNVKRGVRVGNLPIRSPSTNFFLVHYTTALDNSAADFRHWASLGSAISSDEVLIVIPATATNNATAQDPATSRLVKDSKTGQYYRSHRKNTYDGGNIAMKGGTGAYSCILGSHVYVSIVRSNDTYVLRRVDAANLGNEVGITFSGTAPTPRLVVGGGNQIFTNGTDLYIWCDSASVFRRYSISGTTATYVSNTYAYDGAWHTYWCDGANVYSLWVGPDSALVKKYLLSSGALLATVDLRDQGPVFSYTSNSAWGVYRGGMGIVPISADMIMVASLEINYAANGSSRHVSFFAKLVPFSKP